MVNPALLSHRESYKNTDLENTAQSVLCVPASFLMMYSREAIVSLGSSIMIPNRGRTPESLEGRLSIYSSRPSSFLSLGLIRHRC